MPSSTGTVAGRSGSKWKQTRHDQYYFLAKEQGYRSRAAFKLIQINKKFDFLSKCRAVIDLCAAPGGWLQVCQKLMPSSSQIIGVDLLPIKKIPNVVTFTEDITSEKCVALVKKELRDGMVDVVLHDGAPNVGGATWARDAYQQIELVMCSLKMATQFLRQGGTFVTKVFRSQDYDALLWVLKQFFKTITVTKPASSRTASAEIFVVCQGYLAPKKIDPKMLSSSHIFSSTETKKAIDVFHDKAPKKNREGYSDDAGSLLFTKGTVSEFIEGSGPGEILGKYNTLEFDEKSQAYLNHPATTAEIKVLCQDLKVLGMADFSALMKWRKKLLAWKTEQEELSKPKPQKPAADASTSTMTAEEKEAFDDAQVSEQLDALREKKAREEKRAKKQKQERAAKAKKRRELNKHNEGGAAENEEEGLFELGFLKNQEDGVVRDINSGKKGSVVDTEWALLQEKEAEEALRNQVESDDENAMEKELAAAYEQYKQRRGIIVKSRPKVGLGDDDDDEGEAAAPAKRNPVKSFPMNQDERWFDRDVFKDVLDEPSAKRAKKDEDSSSDDDDDDADEEQDEQEEEEDDDEEEAPTIVNAAQKQTQKLLQKKQREKAQFPSASQGVGSVLESDDEEQAKEKGDFEVVPASDYSSDSDAQAERMALGTMMLRKRKKSEIIEGAYNRYAFNDFDSLPDWFRDEEGMHNVASLPITKEMVQAFKSQQKAINVRTSKKVTEAVGRKRKKASQQYEKLKSKAAKIGSETTFKDKMKIYENLAKKKTFKNKRPDKEYVVGKRAGGVQSLKKKSGDKGRKGNKVTKVVDRRQRKDARGMKASEKKKSGKGRGKGKR